MFADIEWFGKDSVKLRMETFLVQIGLAKIHELYICFTWFFDFSY